MFSCRLVKTALGENAEMPHCCVTSWRSELERGEQGSRVPICESVPCPPSSLFRNDNYPGSTLDKRNLGDNFSMCSFLMMKIISAH